MTQKMMLTSLSALLALSTPAQADMNETEKRLLALLQSKSSFQDLLPSGARATSLTFAGNVQPGAIRFGTSPEAIEVKPVAIGTAVVHNCNETVTITKDDFIEAEYKEAQSWEFTSGIAQTIGFSAGGKLGPVELEASYEVEISSERSQGGETSKTLEFRSGYSVPMPPGLEADVQLQITEQLIKDTPFTIPMQLSGKVDILTTGGSDWVRWPGSVPTNAVKAGFERTQSGGKRNLYVCRDRGNKQLGKVVNGRCNYGFAGEEIISRNFEVLVVPEGQLEWVSKREFEDNNSAESVIDRAAKVFYGTDERRDDRYTGQTFVCRAWHKERDEFHSGKVVINDCMIGYGGRERQKGQYEVLTRTDTTGAGVTLNLEEHLSLEERIFVVEGLFDDARSISSSTVLGRSRPVNPARCPDAQLASGDVSVRDVSVASSEQTRLDPAAGGTLRLASASDGNQAATSTAPMLAMLENATPLTKVTRDQGEVRVKLLSRVLRQAERPMFGADVLAVQQALTDAGWPVREDGYYGSYTISAVRKFQTANGLEVDGVIGSDTLTALGL